jgi:hypothetical protein
MKHVWSPLAALALLVGGISLHQNSRFTSAASPQAEARSAPESLSSDAIHRHRTAQPRHWRALVLR